MRWHGLPLWAIDKTHPAHRVISAGLQVNTHWLTLLARADIRGRICPDADSLLTRIDLFAELCRENDSYGQPRPFATNLAATTTSTTRTATPTTNPTTT